MKHLGFIKNILMMLGGFLLLSTTIVYAAQDKRAELVVDVETGRVLHDYKATERRHPASLTKMMTLYMLFEAIDTGVITPNTQMPMSRTAAAKPPSKLGLRVGENLTVRDAIYTLITKSANDVSALVGETLAGSEERFGQKMTQKARELGMMRTQFKNASGLPDVRQYTTAQDMAILGLRLMKKFPHYYKYFATQKVVVKGRTLYTHNGMLRTYPRCDGFKTGYINMSGFNLVASAYNDKNQRLLGVVFGGATANSRNARMKDILNAGWVSLKNPPQYARLLGLSMPNLVALNSSYRPLEQPKTAQIMTASLSDSITNLAPSKTELSGIQSQNSVTQAMQPVASYDDKVNKDAPSDEKNNMSPVIVASFSEDEGKRRSSSYENSSGWNVISAVNASTGEEVISVHKDGDNQVITSKKFKINSHNSDPIAELITGLDGGTRKATSEVVKASQQKKPQKSLQWYLQVGAFARKDVADSYMNKLRNKYNHLSKAQSLLVPVKKGKDTIYRARFAGLPSKQARSACNAIKSSGYNCVMVSALGG